MRNREHNSKNPYQGDAKKVLCVCSAGLLRSPTAANVLHREFGFNTRACGLDTDHALIPIDHVLVGWADEIVVMEESMKLRIIDSFGGLEDSIKVLNVPDMFGFMDERLQYSILENYDE